MAAFPLMLPGTSRPPKLVVFDLDHTLIACDATILWTEFLYEKKIVTDPIWRQYDRDMVKSYAKGVLDIRDFCRKHAGAFRSIPEEKLHALAQELPKRKLRRLFSLTARNGRRTPCRPIFRPVCSRPQQPSL